MADGRARDVETSGVLASRDDRTASIGACVEFCSACRHGEGIHAASPICYVLAI